MARLHAVRGTACKFPRLIILIFVSSNRIPGWQTPLAVRGMKKQLQVSESLRFRTVSRLYCTTIVHFTEVFNNLYPDQRGWVGGHHRRSAGTHCPVW
jgi:hypothetical protein